MSNRITKKELNRRVAERLMKGQGTTREIIDATLEEIYAALKNGESVSLHNFGTFYISRRRSGIAFKFNPGQRMRKLFGWSSTYKGEA
jgi:DNA-binding protein HU-beta